MQPIANSYLDTLIIDRRNVLGFYVVEGTKNHHYSGENEDKVLSGPKSCVFLLSVH